MFGHMRDRLFDLLPLLLAGGILLVFFNLRAQAPTLPFMPLARPATPMLARPTPTLQALDTLSQRVTTSQNGLCNPARPVFLRGMASLKTALGARMGEAVECERVVDSVGNTQQRTTVGLAYYRPESNTACFTTGWDHWAVTTTGQLVYWTGDAVDPPDSTSSVTH